jgi:hypothetical protein
MHVLSLSLRGDQQNEQSLGRQWQSITTSGVDSCWLPPLPNRRRQISNRWSMHLWLKGLCGQGAARKNPSHKVSFYPSKLI